MDIIANLTSLSGVVHRICRTGIYTDNIFRPFKFQIKNNVDKAGTSPSGSFVFLIINGKLFFTTVYQSNLITELIGNRDAFFYDAAFNNEENLFITLSNDSCFHIFEIYPPIHICAKSINIPSRPISFNYFQLINSIKVTVEGQENFFFKFPNLFDPNDPPELQLITNISQDENKNFFPIFDQKEIIEENETNESIVAENQVEPPSNLKDFALQTLKKGREIQYRQRKLNERYESILKRINNDKLIYFDIIKRLNSAKENVTRQVKRIYNILNVADDYTGLILSEPERIDEISNKIENVICDDDAVNREQETEFKNFNFFERIEEISINRID